MAWRGFFRVSNDMLDTNWRIHSDLNIQGEKPLKTKQEVKKKFDHLSIVEGSLGNLKGSTPIQEVVTDRWIRG